VCMFEHNSGMPGVISTKLGTHIAICMCKNLIYIYIYISHKHQFPKGIWMIHVVE
jgi:pyrrolidone-carboxylate peptidase